MKIIVYFIKHTLKFIITTRITGFLWECLSRKLDGKCVSGQEDTFVYKLVLCVVFDVLNNELDLF